MSITRRVYIPLPHNLPARLLLRPIAGHTNNIEQIRGAANKIADDVNVAAKIDSQIINTSRNTFTVATLIVFYPNGRREAVTVFVIY